MFVRGTLVTFRRSTVHSLSLGLSVVVHEGCGHRRKWSLIINPLPEGRKSQAKPFVQWNEMFLMTEAAHFVFIDCLVWS